MKIAITLFLTASVACTAPKLLPFQGHLTDSARQAIGDGAKVVQFDGAKVVQFDGAKVVQFKTNHAPVSGNAVWTGEVHKLSMNKGLVDAILGIKTAFPEVYSGGSTVKFSEPLDIGITLDANDSRGGMRTSADMIFKGIGDEVR